MEDMKHNKKYKLQGLCCANCSAKIEQAVAALPEVKESGLNFMSSELCITIDSGNATDITGKIKKIVAEHEDSVTVIDITDRRTAATDEEAGHVHDHTHTHSHEEDKEGTRPYFIRLIAAALIAVTATLIPLPAWLSLVVYIAAYLLVGYEVLLEAIKNIIKGKLFDENFLMGIASLGAFLIGDHNEAIAVLIFYGVGEMLQDRAVNKSRKNIAGLMDIRPDYANKLVQGNIAVVAPEEIGIGDIILVKPGEKVPLDGIIVKGSSFIDTRALTGESVPREVKTGDGVMSGCINTSGVLEIEVTKPFAEATVTKILELVQSAGSRKAESEKFITKFARYYTPSVVFLAVAVILIPPLLGFGTFTTWLYRGLSFLIISCPCALVLSIPLSFFGGIGGAARQGILIKGGNYLDALKQADTIVFDKTGTLTKGSFAVTSICPVGEVDTHYLLSLAAGAESRSTHPIAKSVLAYAQHNAITSVEITGQISEISGRGVIAQSGDATIYAGNEILMADNGITAENPVVTGSIIHIARNQQYMGYILISDEVKEGAAQAMKSLKQSGIRRTIMLTGDHENAAKEIAGICGIDEYHADLLPQDKVAWFEAYKKSLKSGKVVFVGDGINDAPVLAGADIGIAMGGIGSDAAIEAADIVIMNDDIGKIATAIKVAAKTKQIVMQNIVLALGIKAIIMVLAFLGITSIWFAIFADVGVALLALLNAMRAMYHKE